MTYQDLINTWGEDPNRREMSFEDEYMYIQDWYTLSETLQKKPFNTPYSDWQSHNGKDFTIISPVYYSIEDIDIEALPLWKIRFETGEEIWADPEEIFEIK